MQRVDDGKLSILVGGPVGFGNNIYIVIDRASGESAFVDAPGSAEELIAFAEEAGVSPGAGTDVMRSFHSSPSAAAASSAAAWSADIGSSRMPPPCSVTGSGFFTCCAVA